MEICIGILLFLFCLIVYILFNVKEIDKMDPENIQKILDTKKYLIKR